MGGSDVVHCVRVSLTGTTVACVLGALESGWGLVCTINTHSCDIICGNGAPLIVVVMGPRPGNVARGI